jgi:hypothetical protein
MKRRADFGRLHVDGAAKPIYRAEFPCVVTLWCLPNLELEIDESTVFSHVFVTTILEECTVSDAMPLPEDHPVDFPLEPGETLYAVTSDMASLGYVAVAEV